jgi:DNA-binding CsgD family transcriptional regulator
MAASAVSTSAEPRLTPRQREILGLIALGVPQRAVGRLLGLSFETVRTHVRAARATLDATTVTHAVALALASDQLWLDGTQGQPGLHPDQPASSAER